MAKPEVAQRLSRILGWAQREPPCRKKSPAKGVALHRANGRGRFGGQTARGHPKALPWPKKTSFAVPALRERELKSACRVSILLLFRDFRGSSEGGQQQSATQTLRVHLLGIDWQNSDELESGKWGSGKSKRGLSKQGLCPKGANWAKRALLGNFCSSPVAVACRGIGPNRALERP